MDKFKFAPLFLLLISFIFLSCKQSSEEKKVVVENRDISYMTSGGEIHPLQANMDIRHYTLDLDVDIKNQSISGKNTIDVILEQPTDSILFDLVHFLTVEKITVNGDKKDFLQKHDWAWVF